MVAGVARADVLDIGENGSTTLLRDPSVIRSTDLQSAVPLAVATGVNIRIDEASRMDSFEQGQRLAKTLAPVFEQAPGMAVGQPVPARRLLQRAFGFDALQQLQQARINRLAALQQPPYCRNYFKYAHSSLIAKKSIKINI